MFVSRGFRFTSVHQHSVSVMNESRVVFDMDE